MNSPALIRKTPTGKGSWSSPVDSAEHAEGKEFQLLVDEAVLAVGRSNREETGRELEALPQFDSSRSSLIDNVDPMIPGISRLSSRSHPNILQFLCGFTDEDKKECFLVTELMSCRDIKSYIKKVCGPRNK
ncbi:unnamed protein product [Linum trigynum]|uniref:Protein kinase domain-containing protein n=1 Tax=Linum trigynum TaxID=586398 RepID=A0AAV2FCF2_9ROSI